VDEPDPRTIRAAMAGDLSAFEDLVRTYQTPVLRFLRGFVGDEGLAEEVAQDTFVRCYRRLDGYEFRSRFSTWLFRVARNAAIDAVRARGRRERLVDAHPGPAPSWDPASHAEVRAALAALSPRQREAVLLVEVLGLRYREAAEVLDVPIGTVKSRVFQARERLVAWMNADEGSAGAL
jgi:RNA polymerase sigma-70 factor (ECF subfamily)